jgi:hypothetical protein
MRFIYDYVKFTIFILLWSVLPYQSPHFSVVTYYQQIKSLGR